MLPSPRIGRSDPNMSGKATPSAAAKSPNAVDCTANPEMCKYSERNTFSKARVLSKLTNQHTTTGENTGSSGGGGGGFGGSAMGNNNEDLVEPIDIQLRAAFIPRLGKRRAAATAYNEAADDREQVEGKQQQQQQQQPQQYSRKWVLIPGLGYIDASEASAAVAAAAGSIGDETAEQNSDDEQLIQQQLQRNALIRSLVESSMKRAMPYTPRIGRAVFAPRIGKKATFVPRIG